MIKIDISKKLKFANSSELNIRYEFPSHKMSAIYGRSGAGKTTLLKILAGLIKPEKGFIIVDGKIWLDTNKGINIPAQRRNIGFVFQDYALFPNMTVMQNLRYAAGKHADEKHIEHLLSITGLSPFINEKPGTLSGGQKQRVALARALVRKPALLLLDEPLSAIDTETRLELRQELLLLHKELNFTALLVSHDKYEIAALTSNVLHIDNGQIITHGKAAELFKINTEKLSFTSQVIKTGVGWVEVSSGHNTYKINTNDNFVIGDQVNLAFNPGDAIISKV